MPAFHHRKYHCPNTHQPSRGIETTALADAIRERATNVRTPINPAEGLKHSCGHRWAYLSEGPNTHQPSRGIETAGQSGRSTITHSPNTHQPSRGIETEDAFINQVRVWMVRTPINPAEGLKPVSPWFSWRKQRCPNTHQPSRGIETAIYTPDSLEYRGPNTHQPSRGIETSRIQGQGE